MQMLGLPWNDSLHTIATSDLRRVQPGTVAVMVRVTARMPKSFSLRLFHGDFDYGQNFVTLRLAQSLLEYGL